MKHGRRVLTLFAVSVGAIWLAAAPASALTLSIGGTDPGPLPALPVAASVSTGGDGAPLAVAVDASGSTAINVQADPTTGLGLQADTGVTPPLSVDIAPPDKLQVPLPHAGTDTPVAVPTPTAPTVGAPAGAPTPPVPATGTEPVTAVPPAPAVNADPIPGIETGGGTPAHANPGPAPSHSKPAGALAPLVTRIPRSTSISASIEPTPHPGFLTALSAIPSSVTLLLALIGFAIAIQLYVRSALVARRRHTARSA